MALKDDKPRVMAALSRTGGLRRVLPAWPDVWAELPCAVVTEAANRPADHRDDRERVTELEYYVRVFASRAEEAARAAEAVDAAMLELGYARTMAWEDDGAPVRQKVLRYRIYL